jgi:uncharacterized membrane protein YqjE
MTPTSRSSASPGFVAAFRALGDGVLAGAQRRIELLSVELHEEKFRLVQSFIWITIAVVSGVMTITFASLTLVYLFWSTARLAVLGGLTAFYAAALITAIIMFRRFVARQPEPFAATIQELEEDRACIRNGS